MAPLFMCLLALAVMSNRLVSLRQIAIAADPNTNVQQPLDYPIQSAFTGSFFVSEAQQDAFDLQQLAPPSVRAANDFFRDVRHLLRIESNTSSQLPPYILQSVLNL